MEAGYNENALNKLTYGLYIVTAREQQKDNGCVIDTALQAAQTPVWISICLNRKSLTHDMIVRTGKFNLSVLSQHADAELYERFGYSSGREKDKFENFKMGRRVQNGIYVIEKDTNAYFSVKVERTENLGSHTMFLGTVTEMDVLSEAASVTYEMYQKQRKANLLF